MVFDTKHFSEAQYTYTHTHIKKEKKRKERKHQTTLPFINFIQFFLLSIQVDVAFSISMNFPHFFFIFFSFLLVATKIILVKDFSIKISSIYNHTNKKKKCFKSQSDYYNFFFLFVCVVCQKKKNLIINMKNQVLNLFLF